MTDETKAIGFDRDGEEYQLRIVMKLNKGKENEGWSGGSFASVADLRAVGFVPQSRLLAAEAELGRVKAELAKLAESWMSNAGALRLDGARYETYEGLENCTAELLAVGVAAPPSPPAAVEPAQGAGGVERETLEAVSELVHDNWVSAKRLAGVTSRTLDSTGEELMVPYAALSEEAKELDRGTVRVVLQAQQEQAEREAAGLREQFDRLSSALTRVAIDHSDTQSRLAVAESDRDAERAQKEALRMELEEARSAIRRLLAYPFDLRGEVGSMLHADLVEAAQQPAEAASLMTPAEEREAQAFSDAMDVRCGTFRLVERQRWDDCPTCHAFGGEPCRDQHGNATKRPHQIEPAEAAPVAKACDCPWPQYPGKETHQDGCHALSAVPVAKGEATAEGRKCPLCGLNPHSLTCMYEPTCDSLTEATAEPDDECSCGSGPSLAPSLHASTCELYEDMREAPSEPWVPKVGERVKWRHSKGYEPLVTITSMPSLGRTDADVRHDDGSFGIADIRDLEPAPQPPATTGGAEEPSPFVKRIRACLDLIQDDAADVKDRHAKGALFYIIETFRVLADELEGGKL